MPVCHENPFLAEDVLDEVNLHEAESPWPCLLREKKQTPGLFQKPGVSRSFYTDLQGKVPRFESFWSSVSDHDRTATRDFRRRSSFFSRCRGAAGPACTGSWLP